VGFACDQHTAEAQARLTMPDDPSLTSGLDAAHVYDHPVTTLPAADRKDLGIFYPIMGHMCHLPVVALVRRLRIFGQRDKLKANRSKGA
jgi:hypothetical protein